MKLVEISQHLLESAKMNQDVSPYIHQLETLSLSQLLVYLDTDNKKKAFWINTYNAFATILLRPSPKIILNSLNRKAFFNKKQVKIGSCLLSLNNIEHNILRKSSVWWGKGYLKKWWVSNCDKQLRVEQLDARIHFALNCGGKGCPPIRFYEAETLDKQLEIATQAFLFSEVKQHKNTIEVSKLFNWYIGDFGGKKGLIQLFKKHQVLTKESHHLTIKYTEYNWQPWIK